MWPGATTSTSCSNIKPSPQTSASGGTVAVAKLNELTQRLAKAYVTKSPKTLQRDRVELEKMGLNERTPEGTRARWETILAFLPLNGKVTPNREQAG